MTINAPPILLEVCVGSVADVRVAADAGADRVELCGGLELGGLTPSLGLVEQALRVSSLPVIAMLRPRAGGFCYDQHEFTAILHDAAWFFGMGAAGVAFGILDQHGRVDVARSREIVALADGRPTVFHRAFDFAPDPREALDALMEVGCTRVLTSGGKPTAAAGAATIRELIEQAAGRIEVMPGGGIAAENVVDLVAATGCTQVHIGAAGPADDQSLGAEPKFDLGDRRFLEGADYRAVAAEAVAATAAALHRVE